MRRTVSGMVAVAAIALTGVAGCGGEDAASSAADQARAAAESAREQAPDVAGGAAQQVQQQIDRLLQANPVTFEPESAELTEQSRQTLQQMATALKTTGAKVAVETHSGYEDAQRAQELSEKRAEAISQALQEGGAAAEQVTTNATGNTAAQGAEALKTQFSVTP